MSRWERRLADLAQILANCAATYFDPEAFRSNVNSFLMTSRTVTFLIQKDKAQIPEFESWHQANVLQPWRTDEVMTWAIDSRNFIEKQGDLDLSSKLELSLLFSYFRETDSIIRTGRGELLSAGVKKLIRHAEKELPTHVANDSAVRIERRWVANTLRDWELLGALAYIYRRVYGCCRSLAAHLGGELDPSVGRPPSELSDAIPRVQLIKLRDRNVYSIGVDSSLIDRTSVPPPDIVEFSGSLFGSGSKPKNISELVEYFSRSASAMFDRFGNHNFIVFLFDGNWRPNDVVSTTFSDQVDKYIFWRMLGEQVRISQSHAVLSIGEAWLRHATRVPKGPPRKGEIYGELLKVEAVDKEGGAASVIWEIKRASEGGVPQLARMETEQGMTGNYWVPVLRGMGLREDSPLLTEILRRDRDVQGMSP